MNNLINLYKELLNLPTADFLRIDHEDAMIALVYKIVQKSGEALILKICAHPHHYRREVHFLKHFLGILPVPKIIQTIEPTQDVQGAILMECLPGDLLKPKELNETLAFSIGQYLAIIHSERLLGFGDVARGHLSDDPILHLASKFEEGLNECKPHLPKELIDKSQKYFEANVDLLSSVDGPCIVHRDFRPGNLIVHEGQLQGIIDWAGARSGFAEEDLCSLEHSGWANHYDSIRHLLSGYAHVRKLPNYTPCVPFFRLNKAIATIGFTVKRGTWKTRDSRIYLYNRQFLEQLLKPIQ